MKEIRIAKEADIDDIVELRVAMQIEDWTFTSNQDFSVYSEPFYEITKNHVKEHLNQSLYFALMYLEGKPIAMCALEELGELPQITACKTPDAMHIYTYEMSFSSKRMHTINPRHIIWDSVVTKKHFGISVPYVKKNREEACCKNYDMYEDRFYDYMVSEEGMKVLHLFDEYFPESEITDIKKIDFILWQDR